VVVSRSHDADAAGDPLLVLHHPDTFVTLIVVEREAGDRLCNVRLEGVVPAVLARVEHSMQLDDRADIARAKLRPEADGGVVSDQSNHDTSRSRAGGPNSTAAARVMWIAPVRVSVPSLASVAIGALRML
jgi:hypothetical protein